MPKLAADASKAAKRERVHTEMGKFKRGRLHSGSKEGPLARSREQAIAISMSEARMSRKSGKRGKRRGRGRGGRGRMRGGSR